MGKLIKNNNESLSIHYNQNLLEIKNYSDFPDWRGRNLHKQATFSVTCSLFRWKFRRSYFKDDKALGVKNWSAAIRNDVE